MLSSIRCSSLSSSITSPIIGQKNCSFVLHQCFLSSLLRNVVYVDVYVYVNVYGHVHVHVDIDVDAISQHSTIFRTASSYPVHILLNEWKKPNRFLPFFVMTICVFSYGGSVGQDHLEPKREVKIEKFRAKACAAIESPAWKAIRI